MGPTVGVACTVHSPLSSLSPTFLASCSHQNQEGAPLPPRARGGADEQRSPDCTGYIVVDYSGRDGGGA